MDGAQDDVIGQLLYLHFHVSKPRLSFILSLGTLKKDLAESSDLPGSAQQ